MAQIGRTTGVRALLCMPSNTQKHSRGSQVPLPMVAIWLLSPHSAQNVSTKASINTGENSRLSASAGLLSSLLLVLPLVLPFVGVLTCFALAASAALTSLSASSHSEGPSPYTSPLISCQRVVPVCLYHSRLFNTEQQTFQGSKMTTYKWLLTSTLACWWCTAL